MWVRRVPPNNFLNIERHPSAGPATGGGALYIEAPTSVVPALLELLGLDPAEGLDHEVAVPTRTIGAPSVVESLHWNTKSGGRMRLFQNRQTTPSHRHPAWSAARGFPKAPDSVTTLAEAEQHIAAGLRIYVVRSGDGDFFAGYLAGEYPSHWPMDDAMRQLFTGQGGVRYFAGGLYLDPDDQVRPFRSEHGTTAPGPGGIVGPFDDGEVPDVITVAAVSGGGTPYASPETAAAVDRIAMDRAVEWAETSFPAADVVRMPHNNPGYDLLVSRDGAVVRYIEVKGTTFGNPRFFLSENERRFSEDNAELYTLVIFYGIDLATETAQSVAREGGLAVTDAELRVVQWRGALATTDE